MVTIVNDFSNAEVRVYVNAVLKGRYVTIETNAISEDGYNLVDEDGESSIVSEGLISYQEANRDIPFYLFGNGQENSSFTGKVRLFRIFGWSLSERDVEELYENNRILINTAAETRYLGEFSLLPEDVNLYDVLSEMSGEDLIVALKNLGEGKYQNANVKVSKLAEALSKLSEKALANSDLSNLTETGKTVIKEAVPGVPPGSIICFAGTKGTRFDNGGYFYCDGRAVSRRDYPDLFDAIGETYGKGDGVNTFNVPDFRGCFLRGAGGNSSPVGQQQGDAIRNITAGARVMTDNCSARAAFSEGEVGLRSIHEPRKPYEGSSCTFRFADLVFDAARVVPVANENRPINFAVHYYIKY